MITCPNCGQGAADDSLHCGHCGHQLQSGGMKTMFGMAALTPDLMEQAAAEAKQAREAAEKSANATTDELDTMERAGSAAENATTDELDTVQKGENATTDELETIERVSGDAPTAALPSLNEPQAGRRSELPAPSVADRLNIPVPATESSLAEESSSVFDLPKPGSFDDPVVPPAASPSSEPAPSAGGQPGWANVGGSDASPTSNPANLPGPGAPMDPWADQSSTPAWANSAEGGPTTGPVDPWAASSESIETNQVGADPAFTQSGPTGQIMTNPPGQALEKSGPPVALIAGIGVVVLLGLCLVFAALGFFFF